MKLSGKLGYLGPEGTFSHQAALEFGGEVELEPCATIFQVFEKVAQGQLTFGLVPAENTTEGTIRETLDYLTDLGLHTWCSVELPIHQNLLSRETSLEQIKTVYSHPQALAQCQSWIRQHLPNATVQASVSTVAPILSIQEPGASYLASVVAAKKYNLQVLAERIEDNQNNITKFYLIHKTLPQILSSHTLLFIVVKDRVGVLRDILSILADAGIDLKKIESRPVKDKAWEYCFYMEVEKTLEDSKLQNALKDAKNLCEVVTVIGSV